jgi:hypothetical protein
LHLARSTTLERTISVIGALSFICPAPYADIVGFGSLFLVLVMPKMRKRGGGVQESRKGA